MLCASVAERAIRVIQGLCPGCGEQKKVDEHHCRNALCPDAHDSLRQAINRSPSLQELELQELAQGRNLYETLSIIWFDDHER